MNAQVKNQGSRKYELETEVEPVKQMSHAVCKLLIVSHYTREKSGIEIKEVVEQKSTHL